LTKTYVMRGEDYSGTPSAHDFVGFQRDAASLARRNAALNAGRLEPRADFYHEAYQGHSLSFEEIMQAEFVLFLRSQATRRHREQWGIWYPQTLVYASRRAHPFLLFTRAESAAVYARLGPILAASSVESFRAFVAALEADPQRNLRSGFFRPSIVRLSNAEYLATSP
jgi:hypothetical protein